jgi:class 3 adenylate cyclase
VITGEISGSVTVLFTDVEGSTRLWEREPEQMRAALARHDAIARAAVQAHRGIVVKTTGDGIHAVFDDPLDAVEATLKLQQALLNPGDTGGTLLRVRCGLHLGVVERRDNDVFGTPVNRTARIMAAAHGGQVLVSKAVADLICNRLPNGVALKDLGAVRLRDLASPERVYQVVHPQLRRDFPALRSLEATPNNLPQQVTSFDGSDLVDQQRCSGLPSRLAFLVRRWTPTRASPCRRNRGRERRDIAERCVKYRPNRSHGQFSVKWLVANVEPSRRPSRPNQTLKNATANGKAFRSRHPIHRSHPPTHLRQGRTRRRLRSVSPVPFR